jgi:hypothetical protein
MTIKAQMPVNDGDWHSISWTRSNANAELFVDSTPVGSSLSGCKNTNSIFYFGGTNPAAYQKVIEFIVRTKYFIKNVFLSTFKKIFFNS